MTSVFVTSRSDRAVLSGLRNVHTLERRMVADASGVSPCGTCHIISPLSRSIAESTPYGGLTIGRPSTRQSCERRWRRQRPGAGADARGRRSLRRRVGRAAEARSLASSGTPGRRVPGDVANVRESRGRLDETRAATADVVRPGAIDDVRFGIERRARPVGAAAGVPIVIAASGPPTLLSDGWQEHRSQSGTASDSPAPARAFRREVDQVVGA